VNAADFTANVTAELTTDTAAHGVEINMPLAALPAAAPAERAQAIDCGGISVAVPFSWARSVVEDYELSEVPNAPAWLAGAANVEGRIVAVVDLATWAAPEDTPPAALTSRLLLGGEGDAMFALRFNGLPAMVRCAPRRAAATDEFEVPAALQPFIAGRATHDTSARCWPVVDMAALTQAWSADMVG
jgi:chemotaxis signal transduction protein